MLFGMHSACKRKTYQNSYIHERQFRRQKHKTIKIANCAAFGWEFDMRKGTSIRLPLPETEQNG